MVDSVLLLVDAVEGPMPQTRFVTKKALALGLKPIVVVNKVDRPGARARLRGQRHLRPVRQARRDRGAARLPGGLRLGPERLGDADEAAASSRHRPGAAVRRHPRARAGARRRARTRRCSCRSARSTTRPTSAASASAASTRARSSRCRTSRSTAGPDSTPVKARVNQVLKFEGLEREQATEAGPGDIVLINGIEDIGIGVTADRPRATRSRCRCCKVDEPTLTMNFCVNNSPLAGREGKFVTSRQIRDRLDRELQAQRRAAREGHRRGRHLRGLGPRRTAPDDPAREHAPRGLRARRVASRASCSTRWTASATSRSSCVTADVEDQHQGARDAGARRAQRPNWSTWSRDGKGRVRLEYRIPARGLIGFQNEFLNLTRGTGLISNIFDGYEPVQGRDRRAQERRADQPGRRRGRDLRARQAGRPRPHVREGRATRSTKA